MSFFQKKMTKENTDKQERGTDKVGEKIREVCEYTIGGKDGGHGDSRAGKSTTNCRADLSLKVSIICWEDDC